MLTILEDRDICSVLELVETPFQHVFRADTFYSHQVQNHVVTEVECRVQSIGLSLDHALGCFWLELLLAHHDDDSSSIQSTTSRSSRHLDVFL